MIHTIDDDLTYKDHGKTVWCWPGSWLFVTLWYWYWKWREYVKWIREWKQNSEDDASLDYGNAEASDSDSSSSLGGASWMAPGTIWAPMGMAQGEREDGAGVRRGRRGRGATGRRGRACTGFSSTNRYVWTSWRRMCNEALNSPPPPPFTLIQSLSFQALHD